jgi:hypothetical protein
MLASSASKGESMTAADLDTRMTKPLIKPNVQPTKHRDGTVSYWSVYNQQWVRDELIHIPDQELAAMGAERRQKILDEQPNDPR